MSNLIGQSLGRYQILEQLGQGGMATVYKGFDTRLERDVAIKVIRRGAFPPDQLGRTLKRFEREAKTLAKLSHPNIVKVLDYGEYEGAPYLVLEYIAGGTLKKRLERRNRKPMPWQAAIQLLQPIAHALHFAHQQGVIHRDVKPSNILITPTGNPMLTDFGIAKILDIEETHTLTGTGVGIGTPEYMSPEQGLGKAVGPQTDIYSLGMVLYELITGHKPFQADTPMAVVLKQATAPLPRPSQFVRDLPATVEKILLKALAKNPEDRYQSMGEMAAAMERALSDQSPADSKESLAVSLPPSAVPHSPSEEDGITVDQDEMEGTGLRGSSPASRTGDAGQQLSTPKFPVVPGTVSLWVSVGGLAMLGCVGLVIFLLFLWSGFQTTPSLLVSQAPSSENNIPPTLDASLTPALLPTHTSLPIKTPFSIHTPTETRASLYGQIVFERRVGDMLDLFVMSPSGGALRNLTNSSWAEAGPSWSPDGQFIAFHSYRDDNIDIYTLELATGVTHRLTDDSATDWYPSWSPAGQYIAFYSDRRNGDYDIYLLDQRNFQITPLTFENGVDAQPTWFPDGHRLAYQRYTNGNWEIFAINVDGSGQQNLSMHSANDKTPSVSPDGTKIVFSSDRTGQLDIFILVLRTGEVINLTNHPAADRDPGWSPDGNYIIFETDRDENWELYRMRADGTELVRLTNYPSDDWGAAWWSP